MKPLREIVLDTETTGLSPARGHRLVEVGCVELVDRLPTGRTWHAWLCPGRPCDPRAVEVHGLTDAFLADKPRFADVVDDLRAFLAGAPLVIHNAPFDLSFLDAEFAACGRAPLDRTGLVDTLLLARRVSPGRPCTLDALCERHGVDRAGRERHGALRDAHLLAAVYLHLTGGPQRALDLPEASEAAPVPEARPARIAPVRCRLSAAERAAHAAFVATLGPTAVWRDYLEACPP